MVRWWRDGRVPVHDCVHVCVCSNLSKFKSQNRIKQNKPEVGKNKSSLEFMCAYFVRFTYNHWSCSVLMCTVHLWQFIYSLKINREHCFSCDFPKHTHTHAVNNSLFGWTREDRSFHANFGTVELVFLCLCYYRCLRDVDLLNVRMFDSLRMKIDLSFVEIWTNERKKPKKKLKKWKKLNYIWRNLVVWHLSKDYPEEHNRPKTIFPTGLCKLHFLPQWKFMWKYFEIKKQFVSLK